jgi:hypothetical protein
MGPLDQITGTRGGHEPVERLARGEAGCDDPRSLAFEHWHAPVGAAPPEAVQDAIARAAWRLDPQEYSEPITPGCGAPTPWARWGRGRWARWPAACWGASRAGPAGEGRE